MQTDFGIGGGSAMRGTCLKVDPELEICEISHSIEKFNIKSAATSLSHIVPYWPQGTVFVSVIDPGVGTSRRASVALLGNGSYVVTPDNGSLSLLLENPGIKAVRIIDETVNRLRGTEKVSIFHGRDLFAYCAAKLASGIITFEGVGPEYPVSEVVKLADPVYTVSDGAAEGRTDGIMKAFGNLLTTVPISAAEKAGLLPGSVLKVTVSDGDDVLFSGDVPYRPSFGWVPEGKEVVYNGSDGYLGIGINLGSFAERYGLGTGEGFAVKFGKGQD